MYTALFHPLSPDASGETVVSAEGCVTTVDSDGKTTIRIDEPILDERSAYPFGGKKEAPSSIDNDAESCVFVLSPALSEVLVYTGKDAASPPNTRPNPYRRALLQCLEVPHHMSDFRKLAVNTVDSALSLFDGRFLAETLLGNDVAHLIRKSDANGLPKCTSEVVSALCGSLVNGTPGAFGEYLSISLELFAMPMGNPL